MAKTTIRGSVTLSSKRCTVTVSSIAPLNPSEYTLWIDTSDNNILKRWENGGWVNINDNKVVIQYFNEELKNNYYKKTETNSLIEQIVGDVEIKTDGSISNGYKSLSTRIEESNSSFKQKSDEIVATVKSLKSTVGGEVYTSTPTVPYSEKDLWVQTDSDNNVTIKICINTRTADETFHTEDWKVVEDEILDNYGMISTASYSKVMQLSNKIDLLVSGNGDTSGISLTPKFISLISENINFSGIATFTNSVKAVVDENYSLGMLDKITKTGSTTIDGDELHSTNGSLHAYLKSGSLQLLSYGFGDRQIFLDIEQCLHMKHMNYNGGIKLEQYQIGWNKGYYSIVASHIFSVGHYGGTTAYIGSVIGESFIALYNTESYWEGFNQDNDEETYEFDMSNFQNKGEYFYVDKDRLTSNVPTTIGNVLTVSKDLTVSGNTTLNSILTVSGNATIGGTLTVNDKVYFEKEVIIYASHSSNDYDLQVNGDAKISNLYVNNITASYKTEVEKLIVNNSTTLNSTLTVSGNTTLNSSLTVNGDTTLNSSLTVSGATTLNSSLTVNGDTTHKGNISFSYDIYTNRITYYGITFTNSNYSGNIQYTADGVKVVNRTGEVVGSFGFYNDHWDANLQSGYINAKYENGCGNFKLKADISDGFHVDFLVNTDYPHLQFKQYANWLDIYPSSGDGVGLGTESLPFRSIRAKDVYNSSGVITSSDKKVKENIKDIDDNFVNDLIDSLSAKTYKYIDGTSGRTHCGAIAQDVEKVITDMGLTTKDFAGIVKNYKTKEIESENEDGIFSCENDYETEPDYYLRYEEFIMPLVRYCQLLKQRIEVLENTLNRNEESVIDGTDKADETNVTSEQSENKC